MFTKYSRLARAALMLAQIRECEGRPPDCRNLKPKAKSVLGSLICVVDVSRPGAVIDSGDISCTG